MTSYDFNGLSTNIYSGFEPSRFLRHVANMHCDVEFSDNHLYSSVSITTQNNSVLSESSLLIINSIIYSVTDCICISFD